MFTNIEQRPQHAKVWPLDTLYKPCAACVWQGALPLRCCVLDERSVEYFGCGVRLGAVGFVFAVIYSVVSFFRELCALTSVYTLCKRVWSLEWSTHE